MRKSFSLFVITILLFSLFAVYIGSYVEARYPEVRILAPPPGKGKPGDSGQTVPWGIYRIGADKAWSVSTGVGVVVAVLDTGVDKNHEDLQGQVVWGVSVVGDKVSFEYRDWRDRNGHGTHVTGTIAALFNDVGVVGVSYDVKIYAVKVLSDSGFGSWTDLAEGIMMALAGPDGVIDSDGDGIVGGDPDDDGADIISMSLGGFSYSAEVENAVKLAYSLNVVLVAAAGNEGSDGVTYPAKFPEVIAVAAIDENDNVPTWSSKGPEVELAAPGVNILSTIPNNRYDSYSGTSMAAPHVSGAVALLISYYLANGVVYTVEDIRMTLRDTADDIGAPGWDQESGYGVVRIDIALGIQS